MNNDRNKHVSEEELKKRFIINILIGILIVIFVTIVIIMIPKGNEDEGQKEYSSKVAEQLEEERKNKENSNTVNDNRDKTKVKISIKSGALTEDGAVIVITDTNKDKYTWIPAYSLEQYVNGKWKAMKLKYPENMTALPNATLENETGTLEQSVIWSNKYGTLESGKYRLVKESEGKKFYVQFEISE